MWFISKLSFWLAQCFCCWALSSKVPSRLGIPAMVLFLAVGMLVGSEGVGRIHFDNPRLVQSVVVLALSYILFAGRMDTISVNPDSTMAGKLLVDLCLPQIVLIV